MTVSRRQFMYVSFVAFAAIGVAGLAKFKQPLSECQLVEQWVADNRENIPRTLEGLSNLPLAYRRGAVSTLPMSERRALWREHVSSFLSDSVALNAEQLSVLRSTLAHLDEYVDTTAEAKSARERDGLTIPRVKRVFGDSLAIAIFGTLGPVAPVTKGRTYPNCSCNTTHSFCSTGACSDLPECVLRSGCGWFWCEICDGTCPGEESETDR